jgi:tetratricopeptide (TPR) repeat protein
LALAAYYTGESSEGVEHARRAIAHLERGTSRLDLSWLGQSQWVLGLLLYLRGEFDAALQAEADVEATAARIGGEPRLTSFAAWTRGWIHATRGEWDLGIELCRRSLADAPDPVNAALSTGRLAMVYLEKGDAAAALPLLERSVNELARFRSRRFRGSSPRRLPRRASRRAIPWRRARPPTARWH